MAVTFTLSVSNETEPLASVVLTDADLTLLNTARVSGKENLTSGETKKLAELGPRISSVFGDLITRGILGA